MTQQASGAVPRSTLGSADRPALPGQDPGRVEQLLGQLAQELMPRDAIERLWLADIAYLTVRIEYFRAGLRGYYAARQRAHLNPDQIETNFTDLFPSTDSSIGDERRELRGFEGDDFEPQPGETHLDEPAFTRMLGRVIEANLETIVRLNEVETRLLRERDRVIIQFDRRRRDAVRAAVENAEQSPSALPPPPGD